MNGICDMGGMDGFGPIVTCPGEPVFHADWEARTVGIQMALAIGGAWLDDECRSSIEQMTPLNYLETSYYEHWLYFIEDLLVRKQIVAKEGLRSGCATSPRPASSQISRVSPDAALTAFAGSPSHIMATDLKPRFTAGQSVLARNIHPQTHTRLPRYVRGKRGRVLKHLGSFDLPDTRAGGVVGRPQHAYSVRFEAKELWGPQGGANDAVILDMFDLYLEPTR